MDLNVFDAAPLNFLLLNAFTEEGRFYLNKKAVITYAPECFRYCADDYIEVHMEGASQSEKYCGCDIPSKRLYDRERVNVTFYNNRTADQAGFVLYYKAVGNLHLYLIHSHWKPALLSRYHYCHIVILTLLAGLRYCM